MGEKGEDATDKISKGAERAELSHHELHHAIGMVGGALGGVGELGEIAYGPLMGSIGVLTVLLAEFKKAIDSANASAAQLAASIAAIDTARIQSLAESANKFRSDLSAAADEQEKLNLAYARGNTALDATIKKFQEQVDGQKRLNDAIEKTIESQIDLNIAQGAMTKEQGEAAKQNQRLRLESANDAGDAAKLQKDIDEHKKQLAQAQANLANPNGAGSADDRAIAAAQSAAREKDAGAAKAAKDAEQFKSQEFSVYSRLSTGGAYDEKFKSTEELQAAIDEQKGLREEGQEAGQSEQLLRPITEHLESLEAALASRNSSQQGLDQLASAAKDKSNTAKSHLDTAAEQKKSDEELLRTGADHIKQLQDQLDLQKQITAEVEKQHAAAAGLQQKTAGIEERQRVASGHGTPQEQAEVGDQQVVSAAASERGPQASNDARDALTKAQLLESKLERMPRNGSNTGQVITALNKQMDRLLGFHENPSVHDYALQSAISALERKVDRLQQIYQSGRNLGR